MRTFFSFILVAMAGITAPHLKAQPVFPKSFPAFYKEGHRGGTGLMPENTIGAMKKAIDMGANVIEFDIYTSKDGQVIVTHDPYINWKISLTPDGKELTEGAKKFPVHQMDYEEIRKFDVGSKHYAPFPGQKKVKAYIPLLGELIDSVEEYTTRKKLPGVIYNIEMKTGSTYDDVHNSKPEELVDAVLKVVNSKRIGDRYYIQSFDVRPLQYLHRQHPDIAIGFLVWNQNGFEENIKLLGFVPQLYSPAFKLVLPELVAQCRRSGCKIVPWTVNTLDDLKSLQKMGVDGMITDYPNYFEQLK